MRPYHEAYLQMPGLQSGAYLTVSEINPHFQLMVPHHWPLGDYVMRVRTGGNQNATAARRFMDFGNDPIGGRVLSTHWVHGTMESPQVIEIPFAVTGNHTGSTDGHIVNAARTFYIKEKGVGDHYTQSNAVLGKARAKNGSGRRLRSGWIGSRSKRSPTRTSHSLPAWRLSGFRWTTRRRLPRRTRSGIR